MRLGIVSDTHMPQRAKKLPDALVRGLQGVDRILHAGDWVSPDVIGMFEAIAPVDGVAGNNDGDDIINRLGRKKIVELAGCRIGLVHGDSPSRTTEAAARHAFAKEHVDVIVFGHSHIPLVKEADGVLLFNPGSPTDKRKQPRYSYGIIELGKKVSARHYFYDSKE